MERTNVVYVNVVASTQTTITNTVYQYDYGLELCITGVSGAVSEVHFSTEGSNEAIARDIYVDKDNNILCSIPDAMLKQSKNIRCFIYAADETSGMTLYEAIIPVTARGRAINSSSGETTTDKT